MLQFQPPGFGCRSISTSLGELTYYTPKDAFWGNAAADHPPLIFLHSLGGGSSAFEWSKVYPAFAATHPIIAPDLIGWGASAHPAQDYRLEDYLTMLRELIQRTVTSPPIVFASSLTAGLVVRLAVQEPALFRQLFLVSPSGYSDFGQNYSQGLAAQLAGTPVVDRLIYAIGASNEFAIRNFLQQFLFAQPARLSEEIVAAYLASASQPNAEYAALASLKGNLCFDLADYLGQLPTPTVMLWGEKAWFSRVETGRRLAALNEGMISAFHVIPDAGVLPHLEVPAVVIGLLERHLTQGR